MANPYAFYVLTFDGASLIAQATATNQIVFVGALSKATAGVRRGLGEQGQGVV